MGQPVAVQVQASAKPGRMRFELNRSLTGMGHERYVDPESARTDKPADVLARRLFDTGAVRSVHVFGNMVTVDMDPAGTHDVVIKVVEDLYQYWKPGMQPPSEEELIAQVASSSAPAAAAVATGDAGADPNLSRVPAHLLARSRAALEKARAKNG
jgi:hypothetical protein